MKPISPVIKGYQQHEVIFDGKEKGVYIPLPALVLKEPGKPVLSRWTFTQEERQKVAKGADILFTQLIFDELYHPVILEVSE
jgi:hypothetical protein